MKNQKAVLEGEIEAYLRQSVEARGGMCVKLDSLRGLPDRLILLPHGVAAFAETKRPKGGRVSDAQLVRLELLRRLGFRAFVPRTKEDVDKPSCAGEFRFMCH